MTAPDPAALESLRQLLPENTSSRGLDLLPATDDLGNAAAALWESKRVLILTGFLIASLEIGETDGPPGSIGLAAACDALGKAVCLVTDRHSQPAMEQVIRKWHWRQTPRLICLERGNEELVSYSLLSQFAPDHIVAIERPGQNSDGHYHSMAGRDFTNLVPDSDLLLHLARQQGVPITAIGDGGNEVGMGKIAPFVREHVPHGELICAAFPADNLIVAGISNWGASALAALLSLYAGKQLMHPPEKEGELVRTLVDAGLVDGATRAATLSVDGYELADYLAHYQKIYELSAKYLP